MICSWGAVAELSRQKASRSSAAPAALSPSRLCHASSAYTAPPEVPLKATTSCPCSSPGPRSPFKTPAVKAVWLPPPWHAIATRFLLPASFKGSSSRRGGQVVHAFARFSGYSVDPGSPACSFGRRVDRCIHLGASQHDGSREVEVDEQADGRPEAPVCHAEVGEFRQVERETDRGYRPGDHGDCRAQNHGSPGKRNGRAVTVDAESAAQSNTSATG